MPARVVVVHDDVSFLNETVSALQRAGYEVAGFSDSMAAVGALAAAQRVELLVTRVTFPEGTPHGLALALMTRLKRPGIRILFLTRRETAHHTEGVGEILQTPVPAEYLVMKVKEMLPLSA